MKKLFKPVRYALSAMLAAAFVCATPATASYEKASAVYGVTQQHKLALKYDVYAGGFKAMNASLKMDLDKKAYDMALEAETQGLIGSLFPWRASFNTSGHTDDKGTLVPDIHTERSTWRKSISIAEMSYDPNGKILKTTRQDNGKTTIDRDINEMLSGHAADILTSTLVMLQTVNSSNKCAGKFPVFDGKRRFNITLQDDGKETIEPSKYSSFNGEALRCTLKVEPVAGFKKKDAKRGWMAVQNHTEERNKLPQLWLARLKGSKQLVPVRMEIASEYGSVVAHLSKGIDN